MEWVNLLLTATCPWEDCRSWGLSFVCISHLLADRFGIAHWSESVLGSFVEFIHHLEVSVILLSTWKALWKFTFQCRLSQRALPVSCVVWGSFCSSSTANESLLWIFRRFIFCVKGKLGYCLCCYKQTNTSVNISHFLVMKNNGLELSGIKPSIGIRFIYDKGDNLLV